MMNQRIMLTKKLLKNSLIHMFQTKNIYQISIRELCQFPKKLFSLQPIQSMLNELASDLPENEYEYFQRFFLFGAYEIIRTWINKEERESVEWLAALLFKFIVQYHRE